jgi:amino acid transporter
MTTEPEPPIEAPRPTHGPALRRVVSLPLITLYGLGTTLGAGIYVLIGEVAGSAGLFAPVSFLLAALICALSAFSFAEMSARYPRSAGEAIYVQEGLGHRHLSLAVGLMVVAAAVVSSATITSGFIGYLRVFIDSPGWLAMTLLVLALGCLAAWGIAESVTAACIMTLIEIAGLCLVIWAGAGSLPGLDATLDRLPALLPPLELGPWLGILWGSYLAFYAFIGFEDMVNVAEEVENPTRNMPLSILLVLAITTLLYLAVAVTAVLAMPTGELAASEAPLAALYTHGTGEPATIISIISLFAIVNGALIQMIMASRVLYGLSMEGWLPEVFSRVQPRTRTPVNATLVVTILVLVFALWLPLVTLAQLTSFFTLTIFALVNLALWRIKRRVPMPGDIFVLPRWVPLAGFAVTAGFAVFQVAGALTGLTAGID